MRGVLIVNPQATATSPRVTEVIIAALSAHHRGQPDAENQAEPLQVDVVYTTERGHAGKIGAQARSEGLDLVITLGGDGTINEVVNGMLGPQSKAPAHTSPPGAESLPMLATVPGGSANVFARALGLPVDPVEATGEILAAIAQRSTRTLGLGSVAITTTDGATQPPRWFLANAGLGLDAEIIASMEDQRAQGHEATPARYLRTTLRHYFLHTNRREPTLSLHRAGGQAIDDVFVAIVQNTSPWTYLGPLAVDACPHASFDSDLDVFAVRRMGLFTALRAGRRLITGSLAGSTKRSISVWHDQRAFTITAHHPTPIQVDGEGLGLVSQAYFEGHPEVLRAVVPVGNSPRPS